MHGAGTAFSRLCDRMLRPALKSRKLTETSPVVLVAARNKDSYELVHGIVATAIAAQYDARIVAFRFGGRTGALEAVRGLLPRLVKHRQSSDPYLCFADSAIMLKASPIDRVRTRLAVRSYASSSPSRRDLEHFMIRGARIGDLVFDAFVASGAGAAVNPVDPKVLHLLRVQSARALAFRRFLLRQHCIAVVLKDLAYAIGIPGRVALSLGIDVYAASPGWCDRLSPELPDKGLAPLTYREELDRMSTEERMSARELGRRFLASRMTSGAGGFSVRGVDVWATGSGTISLPASASQKTVLVAPHSFTDAQHAGGVGLFSDAFTWLEFLHSIAQKTDYRWLIKLHPDELDARSGYREEVQRLFSDCHDVHVLSADVQHGQLLELGIDLVLTVYGTIALEYPARGIPAITARPQNPHSAFSYALHPKSVAEYSEILLDPSRWNYPIPQHETWEYAYLHYLVGVNVFDEWGPNYSEPFPLPDGESAVHVAWETLEDERLAMILETCRSWIRSGAYSLHRYVALSTGGHG